MNDNKRGWDRFSADQQGDDVPYHRAHASHGSELKRDRRERDAAPGSFYEYTTTTSSSSSRADLQQFESSSTPGGRGGGGYQQQHQIGSGGSYDDREREGGRRAQSPFGVAAPAGPPLARRQNSYTDPYNNYFSRGGQNQQQQQAPTLSHTSSVSSGGPSRHSNFGPPPRHHDRSYAVGAPNRYFDDTPLVHSNGNGFERERGGGGGYAVGEPSDRFVDHRRPFISGDKYMSALQSYPNLQSSRAHSARVLHASLANMAALHSSSSRLGRHDSSEIRRESWRDGWRAERGLIDPQSKQHSSTSGASGYPAIRSSKRFVPRKFGSDKTVFYSSGSRVGLGLGLAANAEQQQALVGSESIGDEEVISLMHDSELVVDAHVSNCLFALDVDISYEQMQGVFYRVVR